VANAADALADFLEANGLPGGIRSGADPRSQADPRGRASWDIDKQAAANLMEVERVLNVLRAKGEDLSMFRGCLETWFEGVFRFRTEDDMRIPGRRVPAPEGPIRALRALGFLMEAEGSMTLREARAAIDRAAADR